MLDLTAMTQGDALHTLQVYQWITEHLQEITALASNADKAGVTALEAQNTFHTIYTDLRVTRFLPMTVTIFTDEDALDAGFATDPNIMLSQPLDRDICAFAQVHTLNLSIVAEVFGIDADCRTWRKSGREKDALSHF